MAGAIAPVLIGANAHFLTYKILAPPLWNPSATHANDGETEAVVSKDNDTNHQANTAFIAD